jgi:hypothetical protein
MPLLLSGGRGPDWIMLAKKESDPVDGHAGLRKLIERGRFMRTRLMKSKRITLDKQWPCHGWIHVSIDKWRRLDWNGLH